MNTRDMVRQIIAGVSDLPTDFPADANLYIELGVPSIGAMQLLLELEDRFGVQVPDDQFVEATTLDALVALVDRLRVHGNDAVARV